MSEPQATYTYNGVPNQETIVNKAYTIALKHVGMISDLVAREIGKNDSAVVRQAIEFYYAAQNSHEEA